MGKSPKTRIVSEAKLLRKMWDMEDPDTVEIEQCINRMMDAVRELDGDMGSADDDTSPKDNPKYFN